MKRCNYVTIKGKFILQVMSEIQFCIKRRNCFKFGNIGHFKKICKKKIIISNYVEYVRKPTTLKKIDSFGIKKLQ